MSNQIKLDRNPSIRACFPERFSGRLDENNSRRSYTPSTTGSQPTSRNSLNASQDLHNIKYSPHAQTQSTIAEHVAAAMVQPDLVPVVTKLASSYQSVSAHTSDVTSKDANSASLPLPVPVLDKFIAEPSLTPLPMLPTAGNRTSTRLTLYAPLYQAALKGDWGKAKEFLNMHPGALNVRITKGWDTVLHVAAGAKHTGFVEEVIKMLSPVDLELRNNDHNTVLCIAAASGITKIAELMVNKNKYLPGMRGNKGVTPLYIAALFGHRDMVWYLYKLTADDDLTQEDYIGLLIAAISTDLFDVALCVIQRHPELAIIRDQNGDTALHVLARKPLAFTGKRELGIWGKFIYPWICVEPLVQSSYPSSISESCIHQVFLSLTGKLQRTLEIIVPGYELVHEKKLLYVRAVNLVKLLWEQILSLEDAQIADILRSPTQPLFVAAEFGIIELITELIQTYPDLIWKVDKDSRSIFHIAVFHRQEKIFNLIHDLGAHKDMITSYKDKNNCNILHLAGKIAPPNRLNIVSGAALQMQRELLWFKEVEKNVQPLYREMRDNDGRTPLMLFTEEHAKLVKEGEKWMKNTASSCMLVATLITTVMFAAVFTVPGGNDNKNGTPVFIEAKSFLIFAISDAFALFSSVTSILMFLSILTSRYTEEDFLKSLPQRLIIGLAALFFSIVSMLVAFGATFFIVLGQRLAWISVPVALIACIPVTLFAFLQFPLLTDMIQSSYGAGIFS
ncbi:hypothetical protein SLEP1_g6384 [Rubroshorea leprosula]|uniref:PGG domain-containing protein n=1 Tax=Rubroshorea leprosula TaxID=152421 RepID=A0AAV5I0W8_9ROSI|nr:hypothetical protein SLEP1_g6384 [Rubroshorea leprosula]